MFDSRRPDSLDSRRQVAVRAGYGIRLPPVGLGVSVRQKLRISGVRFDQWMSVLDGTKVLLASRGNFGNHGEQSVGVGAINTTHLLDGVQIGQPPSIEH